MMENDRYIVKVEKQMKKIRVLMTALVLAVTMLISGANVKAAESTEETGSISVDMMAGGDLVIYKVAYVEAKADGNEQFVLTALFAGIAGAQDLINDQTGINDKSLPGKFAAVISGATSLDTKKAETDGTLTFNVEERGLYLIVQNNAAKGYYKIDPFLVSVPGPDKEMNVKASPKMELDKVPETTPPVTPPKTPTKLPQTGQLWWPVPVMSLCGLVLIAAGIYMRRRNRADV